MSGADVATVARLQRAADDLESWAVWGDVETARRMRAAAAAARREAATVAGRDPRQN